MTRILPAGAPILFAFKKLVRGFLFLPMILALWGVVLAVIAVQVDRSAWLDEPIAAIGIFNIDALGARSVLSTIAGAMMTVISLVYSMTLVVFTLAAANIGPRLLETFTDNRINQTTIGLIGATFLYSLIVLYIVGDEEVPKVSVALAIVLAAFSFFWLVYFVNDVAKRVMVDNEIGRTQRVLRDAIDRMLAAEPKKETDHDRQSIPEGKSVDIQSQWTGYVTAIDSGSLVETALSSDGFVEVLIKPGSFVMEDLTIARFIGDPSDETDSDILGAIAIDDARAPEGDIQFNIHLNVEIALRALSPGINDSYTAISAIDHLSASLARILQRGAPSSLLLDGNDNPRVWLDIIGVKDMVGTALHPLRRAARSNVLVTIRLIEAINRMASVASSDHCPILKKHLLLIASDSRAHVDNRDDRDEIAQHIWKAYSTIANGSKVLRDSDH